MLFYMYYIAFLSHTSLLIMCHHTADQAALYIFGLVSRRLGCKRSEKKGNKKKTQYCPCTIHTRKKSYSTQALP